MKIILGITGGISAYKIPELIRLLIKKGHIVIPIVTENALNFVTETTLTCVSAQEVLKDDYIIKGKSSHLLANMNADLLVVAPITANTIAKCARGIADNHLTTAFLSYQGKKLIVPAMHSGLYNNPITQENLKKLTDLGIEVLGPEKGDLACGDQGIGRMVEPELINMKIESMLLKPLPLKGKKILITAGGTKENIDPVRIITNRSSGLLGHYLATLASFYHAQVSLITTEPYINNPEISDISYVKSHKDLQKAVINKIKTADVLYMTAAVSDFKLSSSLKNKVNRKDSFHLELESTSDILAETSKQKNKDQVIVGFCLENENKLETAAKEKLNKKKLDFIVANTPENIGNSIRSFKIFSKKNKVNKIEKADLILSAYKILKSTLFD